MGVLISFQSFKLSKWDSCDIDFVELRDGLADSSPLLGKYCGHKRPPTIFANSGSLRLTFTINGLHNDLGFQANFNGISAPSGKNTY